MTTAPPPAEPPPSPPPLDPPAWQPPPPLDPPAWQPPPPPGPPARSQLRRSRTDKILGGVSGGLAEYTGVDALLWRVGFVAVALAGGAGFVVYLLLWLLMPAGPTSYGPAYDGTPAAPRVKEPSGPRSPVPGLTIASLLIVVGILALVDRFSGGNVGPRGFLGVALLVVGLGLIAAAFSIGRRARGGLIALGIVLSLALAAASTMPWNNIHGLRGGVGDRAFVPVTAADVQPVYSGGVGDMTVDLSGVDLSGVALGNTTTPIRTRIERGVGDVTVVVPDSADVRVTVDRGLGDVDVFGGSGVQNGIYPGSGPAPWADDGRPEFVITIGSGVGDVEVSRG